MSQYLMAQGIMFKTGYRHGCLEGARCCDELPNLNRSVLSDDTKHFGRVKTGQLVNVRKSCRCQLYPQLLMQVEALMTEHHSFREI